MSQGAKGPEPASLLVLAASAFLSAVCAVSAVMPSTGGKPVPGAATNKLFFGVFTRGSESEFIEGVLAELHADETVFRTMLRDIYQNGQVLQRKKYRLLGWAYRVFLAGLVLTVLTFAWEHRAAFSGS